MRYKLLGQTDLSIPPIVFGGNVFGWTLDESSSHTLLDDLYSRGFTAIDTADAYSRWVAGHAGGESETIIGNWMKARKNRDSVVVFTKVGYDMGQGHHDLSAPYIATACEDSLRRLQTDYLDLYFTHFDDERTAPEETLRAYDKLVTAGKVRYIGASNMSVARIEQSLQISQREGLAKYQVLQPEYNLYARTKFEQQFAPLARQHKLGVVSYYTLASGFLSGKYQSEADLDKSQRGHSVQKYLKNPRGAAILQAMGKVARRHDVQVAAVAIAWVIASPDVSAPIASATKQQHLEAFEQAIALQLSAEDLDELNVQQPEPASS